MVSEGERERERERGGERERGRGRETEREGREGERQRERERKIEIVGEWVRGGDRKKRRYPIKREIESDKHAHREKNTQKATDTKRVTANNRQLPRAQYEYDMQKITTHKADRERHTALTDSSTRLE
jgi:hypothetical protein